jgi:VanZ family protein
LSAIGKAVWRWGPVLAYAGMISLLSSQSDLKPPFNIWDKFAHATEFGVLAALVWRAIEGSLLKPSTLGRSALYLAGCALYAGIDEIHQAFVPGRDSSLLDVTADVTGAWIILTALWLLSSWRARRSAGPHPAGPGPALTLLSKPDCRLCVEAEEIILKVRTEIPFAYEKVDVSGDADLSSRYGLELPVVLMDGRKIFKFRVDPEQLKRRLLNSRNEVA